MNVNIEKLRNDVDRAFEAKTKCVRQINKSTGKKYELYREKFKVLNEKYWLLQEKLDYYESEFVAGDDEIEIKRFGDSLENMYGIYLKDQGIKVGHIDYRGYHSSTLTGDVGYMVDSRFNGHNYAYKSMCLLSDFLHKNNIPDFYISVFVNNIPSLKIILKAIMNFGGSVVEINDNMVTFKCITKELNKVK